MKATSKKGNSDYITCAVGHMISGCLFITEKKSNK